jgi:hypothetical protein
VEFLELAREIGRHTVANTLRESPQGTEIPVAHVEW